MICYCDDFVILCPNQEEAAALLRQAGAELGRLELGLDPEKTHLTDFRDGLDFLGVSFREAPSGLLRVASPWPALLPSPNRSPTMNLPDLDDEPTAEPASEPEADAPAPLLRSLYVTRHGSRLGIDGERFVVHPLDGEPQEIPARQVDLILLFGYVQVSTQAMHYCLKQGIPLVLLNAQGTFRGMLHACESRFADCQRDQFMAAEDPAFTAHLAVGFVTGKIANSRTVLQRYGRKQGADRVAPHLAELEGLERNAAQAASLDALRGYEGAAARAYFAGWRELLPPDLGFETRRKHPAPDPVNALLDLGYSLLNQNLRGLLAAQGLNPAVGFLHPPRDGHPALASDLMEEFRAMAVDTLVFGGFLAGTFAVGDFERDADAEWPCRLTQPALRRFLEKFEKRMNSPLSHPDEDGRLDYRRVMQRQCRHLAETIGRRGAYRPIRIR